MYYDKVAVLLPVYKGDNPVFLEYSIDSILSQTYSHVFVFIGVDGPIGDSLKKSLSKYSMKSNVKVLFFEQNRGLAQVLNDLLSDCFNGDYDFIARMDADDISLNDRFEKQVEYLKRHLDVDVVGGAIEEIDESSKKTGKRVSYPLNHQQCYNFFRYRDPLAHPAVMFRKRFFNKAIGYRNEYRKNQDTMLWFDGFMNGCVFANLEETVLLFRVTSDFYKNRRNGFARAQKMLKDRFIINKALHYDCSAYLFSFLIFVMTLTPPLLKKFLYRVR